MASFQSGVQASPRSRDQVSHCKVDRDEYCDMPDLISDSESEADVTAPLIARPSQLVMYGKRVIDWTHWDPKLPTDRLPMGVKLFYFREFSGVGPGAKLVRVLAIAYVKPPFDSAGDRLRVYYQSSIFRCQGDDWRRSTRKLIAETALTRLRDQPRALDVDFYVEALLHERIRDDCRRQKPVQSVVVSTVSLRRVE